MKKTLRANPKVVTDIPWNPLLLEFQEFGRSFKGKSRPHGHHLKRSIAAAPKTQTGRIVQRHGQKHK